MAAPVKGLRFVNKLPDGSQGPVVMGGIDDPTVPPGVEAPEGSLYLRSISGNGEVWAKTGAADTDWLELNLAGAGEQATQIEGDGVYACPSGVAVRDVVYLTGPDAVDLADADDPLKQPVIGLVRAKPTTTTAEVLYYGDLGGFTGLSPGSTYFLSTTPGQVALAPPEDPGSISQKIGFARDATTLVVFVDRDFVEN